MYDWSRDDTTPVICTLLKTADIVRKGSQVDIELKRAVRGLPGLRLLDSFFCPVPSLKQTDVPPIPYVACGYNFTMTSPKAMSLPHNVLVQNENRP